jgi:nucleotide-binding universal stress UspA family protein
MYSTILVPLDGSKRAEVILPHVETLAKCFNSKLILLNVLEPVHILYASAPADLVEATLEAEEIHDAEDYLHSIQGRLQEQGIQVDTVVVEEGSPARVISEVAERENVDLVAMASHGLSGLARVFYGNVAAGVLHRIDRPLLIIRSDGDN